MFGKRRRDKLFLRLIENQPTTVKHEESIDIEARKEKEVIDVASFFLYKELRVFCVKTTSSLLF